MKKHSFYLKFYKKLKSLLSGKKSELFKHILLICLSIGLLIVGSGLLWFTTLKIPDLSSFDERILGQSTKIYDKTGQVLLYYFGLYVRRTIFSFEEFSDYAKKATIAIEDAQFYSHSGIRPTSIIRATIANFTTGEYSQGGSTITQQVVKNSLLTKEKTISRKIKEIFLAIKLEKILTKDEILHLYLNESPYGGTIYGIEEASLVFFGKKSKELSLAEAAYLAALPQAPSYFSPFGKHRDELDTRKDLVLLKMLENKLISSDEYEKTKKIKVEFKSGSDGGVKSPHFAMYIRQQLEEEYGDRVVLEGGLKVTTSLDYELQKTAENIVKKFALENEKKFKAKNASLVAIDSKTGQILVMVGSRDYFDKNIEGNYNIATAKRQPGSSFKPFIYVKAFEKGYRPETVLFDLKTQFSTNCRPTDLNNEKEGCYSPENYDNQFRGPMTLRNALAQSINVPAVKLFYLVGMNDILTLTKKLGITTLTDPSRYGLSLVLGGGEVTLLDMVSAYSVFSNNGEKHKLSGILKIEDKKGNVVYEWKDETETVLDKQSTLLLTSILTDNNARIPAYGPSSSLYFKDRDIAAKTGTTNDYRDTWILGYTPQVAVGAWAGNNDNTPIDKKVAGLVVAPMWRAFMDELLKTLPDEKFEKPAEEDLSKLPPVIRGIWKGNVVGKDENGNDIIESNPQTILYSINKDNPLGGAPRNPRNDPQLEYWDYPIKLWAESGGLSKVGSVGVSVPTIKFKPVDFMSPTPRQRFSKSGLINIIIQINTEEKISKVDYFINGLFIKSTENQPFNMNLNLKDVTSLNTGENTLKAIITNSEGKQNEGVVNFITY